MKHLLISMILLMALSACSTSMSARAKKTDIIVADFKGAGGEEVRSAIESRMSRIKGFRVLARDAASLEVVKQEAVRDKNQDDMFMKKGSGVKLREGLAGAKVLHGTCFMNKDRDEKKVLGGLLVYKGEEVTTYSLYCSYRFVNAENHVQELAGDSEPQKWESKVDREGVVDHGAARQVADEVIASIENHLKEADSE